MSEMTPNTFLATLQKHRGGGLLAEASEKLNQLVAAVAATGKRGRMTIQLSVVPAQVGEQCATFHDDITVKAPKAPAPASMWFMTADGQLLKDNPKQVQMEPIIVAAETQADPMHHARSRVVNG